MTDQPDISTSKVLSHEAVRTIFSLNSEDYNTEPQTHPHPLAEQLAICTAELAVTRTKLAQSRQLSERLRDSFEEERMRISREIHDQLGQSLTILKFDVSYIQDHLNTQNFDLQKLQEKATVMIEVLNDTIEIMRHIASDLRPSVLDDLGLAAALEWQAKNLETRTGLCCKVIDDAPDIKLDKSIKIGLFRMAQEALTNVVRHAEATQVHLTLRLIEAGTVLLLEVQDNGKGIEEPEKLASKSLGLLGMLERARLLGGSVRISGAIGHGTTVIVTIPLDPSTIHIGVTKPTRDST